MEKAHQKRIDFGNPVRNLSGQPHYGRKPAAAKILDALIDAMAAFPGTCWAPVEKVVDGKTVEWSLMLNQCPGACGHVWRLTLKDGPASKWLVCEINKRRLLRHYSGNVR
jgi:hypothetical protein